MSLPNNKGLKFQDDGNLVIYDNNGIAQWSTQTNGKPAEYLKVQDDGNLVVYGNNGQVFWSPNVYGLCGGWQGAASVGISW